MKRNLPIVAALSAASLLACAPEETTCASDDCEEATTIRIEPAIGDPGTYDVTLNVDRAELKCVVVVPLDEAPPACAPGGTLGVRNVSFSAGDDGGLQAIRIDRIAALVRVAIDLEGDVVMDREVKPLAWEEPLGDLTCFGEPILCKAARATITRR
ncbi:MAG TPA: hypothetical protein VN033_03025 [Vulgatibacter sp.]|nr:hypothetical protein [Vulgatibacter sp.]